MTKDLLVEKVLMIIEMKFAVLTDYCDASIVCDDIPTFVRIRFIWQFKLDHI